jgi:hypothetical protein
MLMMESGGRPERGLAPGTEGGSEGAAGRATGGVTESGAFNAAEPQASGD